MSAVRVVSSHAVKVPRKELTIIAIEMVAATAMVRATAASEVRPRKAEIPRTAIRVETCPGRLPKVRQKRSRHGGTKRA